MEIQECNHQSESQWPELLWSSEHEWTDGDLCLGFLQGGGVGFLGLQMGFLGGAILQTFLGGVWGFLTIFLGGDLEQEGLLWETELTEQELLADLDLDLLMLDFLTLWEEQLLNLLLPNYLCPDFLPAMATAKAPDLGLLKLREREAASEHDKEPLRDPLNLLELC